MPCEGGCPEVERRINPDTLNLEISTDGGSTWQTDPNSPIQQINAQPPPIPAGVSATKCDAAANGKTHIEEVITACSNQLGTAANIFDLVVGVCAALLDIILIVVSAGALTAPATALAAAIWGAGAAAFALGKSAFDAYWTTEQREIILCALYCNIGEDGSFDAAGYAGFLSKWQSDAMPSVAFNFVFNTVKAGQLKGLNNMCSYGNASSADCSGCECVPPCDFSGWNVWDGTGTLISRNTEKIVVAAISGGDGHYYANVTSGDKDTCCCIDVDFGGVTPEANGFIPCGTVIDSGNVNFAFGNGVNANTFVAKAAVPFTITVSAEVCP